MNAPEFGHRVAFHTVAAKLRTFQEGARGRCLTIVPGERPVWEWSWGVLRDRPSFDDMEVVAAAGTGGPYDTAVDIVRCPLDDGLREGIVVGSTRRHAGTVWRIGFEEGNGWTTSATVPVVCVAVDSGGAPRVYDVLLDDIDPPDEHSGVSYAEAVAYCPTHNEIHLGCEADQ